MNYETENKIKTNLRPTLPGQILGSQAKLRLELAMAKNYRFKCFPAGKVLKKS